MQEDPFAESAAREAQLIGMEALQYAAQIRRRQKIAILVELGGLQARPIAEPAHRRSFRRLETRRLRYHGRCRSYR